MGMVAQGILIRTGTTAFVKSSVASSAMTVAASAITCSAATGVLDFTNLGFTTNMMIQLSGTANTAIYALKSVAASVLTIWGAFPSTGALASGVIITGTSMLEIGEVTDHNGPGGQAAVIDMTHYQSTAKEKKIGLRDEGQLSLSILYNATDAGQKQCRDDRANRREAIYNIIYTDTSIGSSRYPSYDTFKGYCLGFTKSGAVDDKLSGSIVIEINGPVMESTKIST